MPVLIILILLIGMPIAEIAVLIQIGGIIGTWPTIALILFTAVLGTFLLRLQGLQTLRQAEASLRNNTLPVDSLVHAVFLVIAGILLITPGFITDAMGFVLLVPPLRLVIARFLWTRLRASATVTASFTSGPATRGNDDPAIEGEFTRIDPVPPEPHGPRDNSPWRPD